MRKKIIAGNWKMNNTIEESLLLVNRLKKLLNNRELNTDIDIVVAPTYLSLSRVADSLKDSNISVAGQDLFWEESGAFTSAVSGHMLKEAGAQYVIIGHSECRKYFNETNENVGRKIKSAIESELVPILCVGESLDERENGLLSKILEEQICVPFNFLGDNKLIESVIIAYEPVWAIGTGRTATPEQADEAHVLIRNIIADNFDFDFSNNISILYGGSVKPSNAQELLSKENIDGALIGGASLKANDFVDIILSMN